MTRRDGRAVLAAAMSEKQLENHLRKLLNDLGLDTTSFHPPDGIHDLPPDEDGRKRRVNGRYRRGYPDWTILGPGGLLFRELKREGKDPTPAQQVWLDGLAATGHDAGVWRPSDLYSGRIGRELAAIARVRQPAMLKEQ